MKSFLILILFTSLVFAENPKNLPLPPDSNHSLRNEARHAIEKGLAWLPSQQNPKGFWSSPVHPALTGLVLTACMGDPSGEIKSSQPEFVEKGYAFLIGSAKPDGGIYGKDLYNYNTSVSMMALLAAGRPEYDSLLKKARAFVIGQQQLLGKGNPFDGGIGYGDDDPHSDLSNTCMGLEAIYYTKYLKKDKELGEAKDLDWKAAIGFIERCQNLRSVNKEAWASDDPQNKGGFAYFPGESLAGEMKLPSGKTALRSYGSMSYAGLLSYIYADLKRDDPRVKAVYDWLQRNFSLEENPGMGPQGLYYYFQTMAKGLSAYGTDELELKNGKRVKWREELALKLINLQHHEGFWVNDNGRFWEKDPVLVTAYALIALEMVEKGL